MDGGIFVVIGIIVFVFAIMGWYSFFDTITKSMKAILEIQKDIRHIDRLIDEQTLYLKSLASDVAKDSVEIIKELNELERKMTKVNACALVNSMSPKITSFISRNDQTATDREMFDIIRVYCVFLEHAANKLPSEDLRKAQIFTESKRRLTDMIEKRPSLNNDRVNNAIKTYDRLITTNGQTNTVQPSDDEWFNGYE